MRFLFLGDSYICCEKELHHKNRWPLHLAARAAGKKLEHLQIRCNRLEDGEYGLQWLSEFELIDPDNQLIAEIKIIAKTAKRSDELYLTILQQTQDLVDYDAIFILIGVNDQFQTGKYGIEAFELNLRKIITEARAARKLGAPIVVLAIPDWNATPMGNRLETHIYRCNQYKLESSTKESSSQEIMFYNSAANKMVSQICEQDQFLYFIDEIPIITREFGLFPGMTQEDGLHYCWAMTEKWNNVLFDKIPLKFRSGRETLMDKNR